MTENRLKKTNYESPLTEAIDILPEGMMCLSSGPSSGGEGGNETELSW